MPDQHSFFYTPCLEKDCNEVSKFPVNHSVGRCIINQSEGHGFENFSGDLAKVCNSGVCFHELRSTKFSF